MAIARFLNWLLVRMLIAVGFIDIEYEACRSSYCCAVGAFYIIRLCKCHLLIFPIRTVPRLSRLIYEENSNRLLFVLPEEDLLF